MDITGWVLIAGFVITFFVSYPFYARKLSGHRDGRAEWFSAAVLTAMLWFVVIPGYLLWRLLLPILKLLEPRK